MNSNSFLQFSGDLSKISQPLDLDKLKTYIHNDDDVVDVDGNIILNANEENTWFAKNIAFIFIMGIIFDDNDQAILNEILSSFRSLPDQSYLLNIHKVIDYKDIIAKTIEEDKGIMNGNYHILFAEISYDDMDGNGIIETSTDWTFVKNRIDKHLLKYGLLAKYERPDFVGGINGRGSIFNEAGDRSRVNINIPLSSMPTANKEAFAQREQMLYEMEHQRNRQVAEISQRAVPNPLQKRNENRSLMTRMRDSPLIVPKQYEVGTMLRMNESYIPPEGVHPQFKLYPSIPDTYDEETRTNLNYNTSATQYPTSFTINSKASSMKTDFTNFNFRSSGPIILPK